MSILVEKTAISLVTGAMGSLLPKLAELVKEEYKLKKSVKEGIDTLEKEMKSMHAALHKVAEVPRDQLDEQIKLWAGEVRELSFDMEDIVDKFLVRVDDDSESATKSNKLKRLTEKMAGLFTKGKARHEIADAIKDINKQVQEIANRRGRYTVDSIVSRPAPLTTIDPRLVALYTEVIDLVGISRKRDQELIKLLSGECNIYRDKLKIVSVVGFGGLGKTTLVKTVYDKIKGDFDCVAFVPVGRNADAKKVFMDILVDLHVNRSDLTDLDERQLIDKLRESLENKRYLIVIDDIWDKSLWRVIKCAFSSKNNFGSRLITTTRILNVATFCYSSSDDSVYQMEPLSDDDSRRLFYNRIFSHERGCPHEFEEVSINILNKCGGVPLAIITIASLLAGDQGVKHVDEWYSLLGSIGRGLTEDPCVEEMLRILSLSYDDLPSHLKTCLLFLSMFPEDYKIDKDRLIWLWIAESFVQCGKAGTSLYEIGETYFNELANRNMIQLVYHEVSVNNDREVIGCRVHDMVLDLILSLSREDNFVTILSGTSGSMLSGSKARRLALQNTRKEELETTPPESVSMLQVRSVVAFEPAIDLMPQLSKFAVLRVLDLADCNIGDQEHLNLRELGSLFHLRYLSLANTGICELPEEVGKLQFLQVLDLSGNDVMQLPSTIVKLRRLMCLVIGYDHKRLPEGLGNLISMEVLRWIHCDSLSIVEELGNMGRLRRLDIAINEMSLELEEAIAVSLGKLSNIQCLRILTLGIDTVMMDLFGERWVPPPALREFVTDWKIHFSTLPAWIKRNPSRLSQLSKIHLYVEEVRNEDLEFLGRLPALRNFYLKSKRQSELLCIGADCFRYLTSFSLWPASPSQIMFCPGALPKVEYVFVCIELRFTKTEAAGNGGGCFDLGMENLRSLRKFVVVLHRSGVMVGEAEQAETELKNTLSFHPNRPELLIIHRRLQQASGVAAKLLRGPTLAATACCGTAVYPDAVVANGPGMADFVPQRQPLTRAVATRRWPWLRPTGAACGRALQRSGSRRGRAGGALSQHCPAFGGAAVKKGRRRGIPLLARGGG